MNNLVIELSQSSVENVTSDIIEKLYLLAKTSNVENENNSFQMSLKGSLYSSAAYEESVLYLRLKFPQLIITILDNHFYIRFADNKVEELLLTNDIGDGIGVTISNASTANLGTIFKNNTSITSFNEFKYFTRANTNPSNYMFEGCSSLRQIDLSNITALGHRQFYGTGITIVNMPNLLVLNEHELFANCPNLTSVQNLGTITNLSNTMFMNCANLESVTLPATITTLRVNSFYDCHNLKTINLQNISAIHNNGLRETLLTDVNINDLLNLVSIGEFAFLLTHISGILNLPKLTTIGSLAFDRCSLITGIECLGKLSTISDTRVFYGTGVTYVKLPYECTTIGNSAFEECSNLTSIKQYTDSIDNWAEGEEPTTGSLSRVTSFKSNCFRNCSLLTLTQQDIQNAINIGECAFINTLLSGSIDLSNVTSIGGAAFLNTKITSVTFALSTIPWDCFNYCKELSEIHLANTVHSFSSGCFRLCTNLLSIDYDFTNCTSLDSHCFLECHKLDVVALTQVVNDSNATNMDHSCFLGTSVTLLYLPKIEIPKHNDTNYNQDEWNFLPKSNIGVVYFKQLRKMYPGWFRESTVLKLVINNTTPPQWCYSNDASTYNEWYENKTLCLAKRISGNDIIYCTNDIYVPDSAVSTYLADANWSAVALYIKPISDLQTVATKALWDALPAADKPNTLIEEYM